jgi:hypothetical protein
MSAGASVSGVSSTFGGRYDEKLHDSTSTWPADVFVSQ